MQYLFVDLSVWYTSVTVWVIIRTFGALCRLRVREVALLTPGTEPIRVYEVIGNTAIWGERGINVVSKSYVER